MSMDGIMIKLRNSRRIICVFSDYISITPLLYLARFKAIIPENKALLNSRKCSLKNKGLTNDKILKNKENKKK